MDIGVLRNERGGYNKVSVLAKLDMYNNIILMLEDGRFPLSEIYSALEEAEAVELKREKGGLFGRTGFSVEDTDDYISALEDEIKRKAMP